MQFFLFVCSLLMRTIFDSEGPSSSAFLLVIFALELPLTLLLILIAVSVNVRRLHDLSYSGWWLLWAYLAAMALGGCVLLLLETEAAANHTVAAAVGLVGALMMVGLIVCLGFVRGTVGPNQFGPDPLS